MTELNHETRSVRLDTPQQKFKWNGKLGENGERTNECIVIICNHWNEGMKE